MAHTRTLSYYLTEHTQFLPITKKLSAANLNRARKKPNFCRPIRIQYGVTQNHRRALGSGRGPFSALGPSRLAVFYLNRKRAPPTPPPSRQFCSLLYYQNRSEKFAIDGLFRPAELLRTRLTVPCSEQITKKNDKTEVSLEISLKIIKDFIE